MFQILASFFFFSFSQFFSFSVPESGFNSGEMYPRDKRKNQRILNPHDRETSVRLCAIESCFFQPDCSWSSELEREEGGEGGSPSGLNQGVAATMLNTLRVYRGLKREMKGPRDTETL